MEKVFPSEDLESWGEHVGWARGRSKSTGPVRWLVMMGPVGRPRSLAALWKGRGSGSDRLALHFRKTV